MSIEKSEEKIFLKYIKDLTDLYKNTAKYNKEMIEKLGFTIEELSEDSGLNEAIADAQKKGLVDALLSGSAYSTTGLSDSLINAISDNHIQNEIIRMIHKINHEMRELEEKVALLKRDYEKLQRTNIPSFDKAASSNIDLRNRVSDHEESLKEILNLNNLKVDEDTNWSEIIANIKKRNCIVKENLSAIQKCEAIISEKYKNLPANVLLAKDVVADLKRQCVEMDSKINFLITNKCQM